MSRAPLELSALSWFKSEGPTSKIDFRFILIIPTIVMFKSYTNNGLTQL